MLDDTFVQKIATLATDAHRPAVVQVPGESPRFFYLFDPATQKYTAAEKRQNLDSRFLSLPTLADYANSRHGDDLAFWFGRAGVTLTAGHAHGEDRATLPLGLSAPMRQLSAWERSHQRLKQDQAALLLRTVFAGAATPGDLLQIVSGVQWKIDEVGRSAVAQGSRSVGKAIEARLENRDRIPDTVVFDVPVWENGGALVASVRAKVACALDADPSTQTFLFVPQAGAVEAAVAGGEADLERLLRAQVERAFEGLEPWPLVLHGTPTA